MSSSVCEGYDDGEPDPADWRKQASLDENQPQVVEYPMYAEPEDEFTPEEFELGDYSCPTT